MKNVRNIIFWSVLTILALIPRMYFLGRDFYSIDSNRWFRRAVNFQHAFLNGDFAGTYQKQHPGVTTMWLGGTAYRALTVIYPKLTGHILDENIPNDFVTINFVVKLSQVLATLTLVFIAYRLIKKCFDRKIALLYLLLVLIDPFFLFYTRQFHVDVLFSSFSLIGVLYTYLFINSKSEILNSKFRYLLLSAVFFGLAFLSKSPAIVIAFGCGLAILIKGMFVDKKVGQTLKSCVIFSLILLATYLTFFPANWVNPVEVTRQIIHDSLENTDKISSVYIINHADSNFGDKFYLLVFLFRFSPFLVAGILFLTVRYFSSFVIRTIQKGTIPTMSGSSLMKFLPFSGYLILLALLFEDNKLYERYLLPFVLPLTLLVAYKIAPRIKTSLIKPATIFSLVVFSFYQIFVIAPNFIVYPTLFATRNIQMKLFIELGGCESMLYNVASDINNIEGNDDDTYSIGIGGTYKGCLKPYTIGVVDDMAEYVRRKTPLNEYPKYLVLFKTDNRWLESPYIMSAYNLINTYYISTTPIYYLYQKKI